MNKKIAYILTQNTCAIIELAAMKAANAEKFLKREEPPFKEKDFLNLINKHKISPDAVANYLKLGK